MADPLYRLYTTTLAASNQSATVITGELNWQHAGDTQNRTISVTMNATDSILLEFTLDGTNWYTLTAALTGATAAVVRPTGPYKQLRATKTGTNGAATINVMG